VEGRPLDDGELIERARQGDRSAYDALVRENQAIALRVAYVVCGSATDAEDAVQDGFVKAWRALSRFRTGAQFRPWLLAIVANEARNRRRSAGRAARLALRAIPESRPSGDAAPSPEETVIVEERRRNLLAALETLPVADRDVIACRYLLGLSEAETASTLGCARGTVKSRLSRALARLRVALSGTPAVQSPPGGRP
jgi:RNA polymerase sigma factor (sigma-70 family)